MQFSLLGKTHSYKLSKFLWKIIQGIIINGKIYLATGAPLHSSELLIKNLKNLSEAKHYGDKRFTFMLI